MGRNDKDEKDVPNKSNSCSDTKGSLFCESIDEYSYSSHADDGLILVLVSFGP